MFSVVGTLSHRIKFSKTTDDFKECLKILEVLLVDAKIDLLEIDIYDEKKSSNIVMLLRSTTTAHQDLNLLKKTIIDKRGEEEYKKCLESFLKR